MANRDVIVVGASAGGVEALRSLVRGLPQDLPATVLVVLHLPPGGHSALPAILSRAGALPAGHPQDNERLQRGKILVAPPDHHMTVVDGRVRLTHGPSENGHRPAIDPLFRTAARWHGRRVIGTVLSGTLDDGTAGQVSVANLGGLVVVQDPADALYPAMPASVLRHVSVDHVAPASALGALLGQLARAEIAVDGPPYPSELMIEESAIVDPQNSASPDPPGRPAGLGCVACGGSLYEIREGSFLRFRCRVGHAWSADTLLAEQSQALESALWMALRTLEDRGALCRRSEGDASQRGLSRISERYAALAKEAEAAARVMRRALEDAQREIVEKAVPAEDLASKGAPGTP